MNSIIDLSFLLTGASPLPADHGYALYGALSRLLPENGVVVCPGRPKTPYGINETDCTGISCDNFLPHAQRLAASTTNKPLTRRYTLPEIFCAFSPSCRYINGGK